MRMSVSKCCMAFIAAYSAKNQSATCFIRYGPSPPHFLIFSAPMLRSIILGIEQRSMLRPLIARNANLFGQTGLMCPSVVHGLVIS